MTSPGKSFNTINGKQPNINNIWKGVENIDFSNVAKEKIVISSRNDKIVPYNN
jgi:predicted alpha/beta hydrolase family esterase